MFVNYYSQRSGLGEGRQIILSFGPSRTTNIFLFNGEANTAQAFAKPHVVRGHLGVFTQKVCEFSKVAQLITDLSITHNIRVWIAIHLEIIELVPLMHHKYVI